MMAVYSVSSLGFVCFVHHCKSGNFSELILDKKEYTNSYVCCCCGKSSFTNKQEACECGRSCEYEESETEFIEFAKIPGILNIEKLKIQNSEKLSSNCCTLHELKSEIKSNHLKSKYFEYLIFVALKTVFCDNLVLFTLEDEHDVIVDNIVADHKIPIQKFISHIYYHSNLRDYPSFHQSNA